MARALLLMLLLTGLAGLASPAARADWAAFYSPPAGAGLAPSARGAAPGGVCIREILKAQLRHHIPGNLLLGIGLQEAGMMHEGELTVWPWVANADGDGRFFDNPATAVSWIRAQQAAGVASIDIGCMQINLRWHPEAFATLEQGLDPALNVDYAARHLAELYRASGNWTEAAGRYHSRTETYKSAYIGRLQKNVAIANERLEDFRALAAAGGGSGSLAAVAPLPGGHFWTSDLTRRGAAASEAGARSLFGRETLQPVLPAFEKMF